MLYLHIGFHKTGTTYLQREVFKKVFLNSNKFYYKNLDDKNKFNQNISLEYFLDKYCEKKYNNYFYSNETILQKNKLDFDFISNSQKLSESLNKKNIKDFKILITVRRQVEMIQSLYKDSLGWGYHNLSFQEFLKKYNYFSDIFDYNSLYKNLTNIFGKENIEIVFFENYTRDNNFKYLENFFQKKFDYQKFKKNEVNKNISNASAYLIFLYYKIFALKKNNFHYKIDKSLLNLIKDYQFKNFFKKSIYILHNVKFYILISKYLDGLIKDVKIKIFNQRDTYKLFKKFEASNKQLAKFYHNCPKNYFIQDK